MHVVVFGVLLLLSAPLVKLFSARCMQVETGQIPGYVELYSGGVWCEDFMFLGLWYLNPNFFIANIFIVA